MICRLTAIAGLAWLSTLTCLAAAEQDPQPPTDQQTTKSLEMAEDLEIMGAVLHASLTEFYAPSAARQPGGALAPLGAFNPYGTLATGYDLELGLPRADSADGLAPQPNPYAGNLKLKHLTGTEQVDSFDLNLQTFDAAASSAAGRSPAGVVRRPQGAFVADHGVVYQIELDVAPPSQQRPEETAEDAHDGSPDLGPWEAAAKGLRGEPIPKPARKAKPIPRPPTRDELVDRLLEVLAENAPNFRHLTPQDRLTVAITFPRAKATAGSAEKGKSRASIADEAFIVNVQVQEAAAGAPSGKEDLNISRGYLILGDRGDIGFDDRPANTGDARSSHEVSGDLHMRQTNYRKAVEAYRQALKRAPTRSAVQIKLAQAYLALGNLEEAQKLIERARKLAPDSDRPQDAVPGAQPRQIPLPAKLTVSVPKSRLDEVAAGKLKREDLKPHATVDYFNPPTDRPGVGAAETRRAEAQPAARVGSEPLGTQILPGLNWRRT